MGWIKWAPLFWSIATFCMSVLLPPFQFSLSSWSPIFGEDEAVDSRLSRVVFSNSRVSWETIIVVDLVPYFNKQAQNSFMIVHSAVWHPCYVTSKLGFHNLPLQMIFFVFRIFIDQRSSEVFSISCPFHAEINLNLLSIQVLHNDDARVFSNSFSSSMQEHGLIHQL